MSFKQTAQAAVLAATAFASSAAIAHEDAQTTTVRWGPIVLPAATSEGPGERHNEIAGLSPLSKQLVSTRVPVADYEVEKPCTDCYIVAVTPNLVLENGETANFNNGIMLHHVVNTNWSEPDVTCRPSIFRDGIINNLGFAAGGNERFFASGNERTGGHMSAGYGYYVSKFDDWGLIYHLMNMSQQEQAVYFEYTFTWVDASEHKLKKVRPIWMDIDQCQDSELDIPAGYVDATWDWKSDRTHQLTTAGGHVHNRGINAAWTNLTQNDTICNSVAGYAEGSTKAPIGPGTGVDEAHPVSANVVDSDPLGLENYKGNISDMTVCEMGDSAPVTNKGDNMRLNVQINSPEANDHAMGIMVGFMSEKFCLTDFWCM